MMSKIIRAILTCAFLMGSTQFHAVNSDSTITQVVEAESQALDSVNFESIDDHNHYLHILANKLEIEYTDLYSLIAFETGGTFDPSVTNPYTGARGLIQFTNSTSKTLRARNGRKFTSASDLVAEYPSVKDQLEIPSSSNRHGGPVYQYLIRNYPYKSKKELFMTVFYPVAINWPDSRVLPAEVTAVNPGFNTVGDYIRLVESRIKFTSVPYYD